MFRNNLKMKTNNSNNKGVVLITVLWIVIVLTVIVAALGRKSRLDTKIITSRMEGLRCRWAARAGIERAIAILNTDLYEDEVANDCLTDIWSENTFDFNDFPLERCWFNVIVTDESGKLNINTATRDQLLGLPNMSVDIADAIIDWRDTDENPSEFGLEGGYYENLPYGYVNRNSPFRTIRELLLVRGVTEELFYGEDTNLNGRLDYNEMDGEISLPYDNQDEFLDRGWAAYLTCYPIESSDDSSNMAQTTGSILQNFGEITLTSAQTIQVMGQMNQNTGQTNQTTGQTTGQTTQETGQTTATQTEQGTTETTTSLVNINTASDAVLTAMLGGDDIAYTEAMAIINYRNSLTYGIEDPSELVDQGVLGNDSFSLIENYITVSSNIFHIRSVAIADRNGPYGATVQIEAVVDRSTSPCEILYWYQGASN